MCYLVLKDTRITSLNNIHDTFNNPIKNSIAEQTKFAV